ncbi:MAG: excisionase family DNA-binding protein [Streptosporangiaceae bacterium]
MPVHVARSPRKYISIESASDLLGCSPRTVRRMVSAGEITGYRLGKRLLRFDLQEVETALRPIPAARGGAA